MLVTVPLPNTVTVKKSHSIFKAFANLCMHKLPLLFLYHSPLATQCHSYCYCKLVCNTHIIIPYDSISSLWRFSNSSVNNYFVLFLEYNSGPGIASP